MAKRLRVRDKLLLAAAIVADAYFEIAEPISVQYKKMKGFLPPDYKATNFTAAVSRMLKTGYMEKVIKNGEPYLRITNRGKKTLMRDFSYFSLQKRKWDGAWRIVFYDIPEKERKIRVSLQSQLKNMGFGALQESVYVSPFDVAEDVQEFVEAQNLEDCVFVSVSRRLFAGNEKVLAEKVWDLEALNEKYGELYQKIKEGRTFAKVFSEYEELLRADPCLPKELLPSDWRGEKVYQEVRKLLRKTKG